MRLLVLLDPRLRAKLTEGREQLMGEDGELGLPCVVKDCIAVLMIEGQSESLTLGNAD